MKNFISLYLLFNITVSVMPQSTSDFIQVYSYNGNICSVSSKKVKDILGDLTQYYVNYKKNVYGPYDLVGNVIYNDSNFIFSYKIKNEWYVINNDKIVGHMQDEPIMLFNNNRLIYEYGSDKGVYINDNGKTLGPFINIYSIFFDKKNRLIYTFADISGFNISIDTLIYGPYETWITGPFISNTGESVLWGAIDKGEKKIFDKTTYIYSEKMRIGPFVKLIDVAFSNEDSHFALIYEDHFAGKDYSSYYMLIDGKTIALKNQVWDIDINRIGNIALGFRQTYGEFYYSYNEILYGPYPHIEDVYISYNETEILYIASRNEKYRLNLSLFYKNKEYGPFSEINSIKWLNNDIFSFRCIQGMSTITYLYLNEELFVGCILEDNTGYVYIKNGNIIKMFL